MESTVNTDTKNVVKKARYNRDEEVLAAAIEVMSERGYPATTIQEVADRVGVLKGSLYHYFKSKEDLLFRILEGSHTQNRLIVEKVQELQLSAFDELLEYLRRICLWYLDNGLRATIFFTESRHLTGQRLEQAKQKGRDYERYIQDLVDAAQADGEIRSDIDGRLITRFLLGAVNNARTWPSRSRNQFSHEEIVGSFLKMVRSSISTR